MSYKTDRTVARNGANTAEETTDNATAPTAMLADLSRQQMVFATDFASALFRGSEAMRHIQQQVAHQALERHQSASKKLRNSHEPADLLAVQTELMRFDMDGAAQYWQQLANAAFKMQVELIGCVGSGMVSAQPASEVKHVLWSWQEIFFPKKNSSDSRSA